MNTQNSPARAAVLIHADQTYDCFGPDAHHRSNDVVYLLTNANITRHRRLIGLKPFGPKYMILIIETFPHR